jgi:NAD+ kinase
MRIKFLLNGNKKVDEFKQFISDTYPKLLTEENPDLYLVAGGDGAMLHAIHENIDTGVPYFGKALGTLNFLMNKFDNDKEIIDGLLEDRIGIYTFKSNSIVAYLDGNKLGESVNEVILGEDIMGYHKFNISTENGDFKDFEIEGSGICISTAIGSTAFNYNNGGRILPLDSNLLSITGIVCNKYLNDILPFQEITLHSNGARIYLTNVKSEILKEGGVLKLKKGKSIKLAFLNKEDFLKRRIELAHRYRR